MSTNDLDKNDKCMIHGSHNLPSRFVRCDGMNKCRWASLNTVTGRVIFFTRQSPAQNRNGSSYTTFLNNTRDFTSS